MVLKQIVEALVFASQKPLTPREIVAVLRSAPAAPGDAANPAEEGFTRVKEAEIAALLEQIKIELIESGRAFQLVEQASGWQLVTDPSAAPWVRLLYPEARPTRLSGPALETLAIVAYRQQITKADIEAVRGVAVDGVLQSLLERNLVRIAGRAEIPGRPLLYETTQHFLEHFGLRSLDEMPNSEELRRIPLPKAELRPAPPESPPPEPPPVESAEVAVAVEQPAL